MSQSKWFNSRVAQFYIEIYLSRIGMLTSSSEFHWTFSQKFVFDHLSNNKFEQSKRMVTCQHDEKDGASLSGSTKAD